MNVPFRASVNSNFYWGNAGYSYHFNGKESDNDWTGNSGDSCDFGARIYDTRLGKFLSVDPKQKLYVDLSVYSSGANNPIRLVDVNGQAPGDPISPAQIRSKLDDGKVATGYSIALYVDQPIQGSPLAMDPNSLFAADVGHAFIAITKYNADGTMTTANFGWYPAEEGGKLAGSPFGDPCVPGTLKDDGGHSYDAAISLHGASVEQVNSVLEFTDTYQGANYCLAGENCCDFAIEAAQLAGMNVPTTTTTIPLEGPGYTPGQLGVDIQTGKANVQPAGGGVSAPATPQVAYDYTNTGMTYNQTNNNQQKIVNQQGNTQNQTPPPAIPAAITNRAL